MTGGAGKGNQSKMLEVIRRTRNIIAGISHKWQLAIFVAVHILILAALFNTVYKSTFVFSGLYFGYASQIMDGGFPYRDFALEYPPFSLLFFILPRLAAPTWQIYSIWFQAEVIIFDLIGLLVIYSIAKRLGKAPWKMLSIYTVGLLAVGPIIGQQFDIFPAVMVLLSLYYFWLGKHKTAWALLALGAMTKIYPVVIAPIFLIYYIRNHQYIRIRDGIITFAAVSLAIALPFLIMSPDGFLNFFSYHAQRGIQLESTYSGFLLVADKLDLTSVSVVHNFGSYNVSGQLADTCVTISNYLPVVLLFIAYWIIYKRMNLGKPDIARMGAYSLLAVLILLISSRILSPQYLIWLIPLLPLLAGRWRYPIWILFVITGALTYYIFPWHYTELAQYNSGAIAVLMSRNILLIVMAVLAGVSLFRKNEPEYTAADGGGGG